MFRKWVLPAVVLTPLANAAYADDAKQLADALADKWMKAYNSHSPEGIAALFTNEAPFIGPPGVLKGRASIEKAMAGRFSAGWTTETIKINEAHMVGDAVWAVGEFQFSGSGEQAGKQQSGHFGEVLAKDGADWHIVMLLATPSAAPSPPK
jgi:uncharacterized protein (TIGR02246 family)